MASNELCWLMMEKYVRIADKQEIPKNKMKVFKVEDHEILVVNVEGDFYAFENRCPHMGYSLYLGSLEGKVLTCGFHSPTASASRRRRTLFRGERKEKPSKNWDSMEVLSCFGLFMSFSPFLQVLPIRARGAYICFPKCE